VSVALRVTPYVPEITTEVLLDTTLVVIVKVAELLPAGMFTDGGTCAAEILLLCSVTNAPPPGAAPVRVTVPVALFPPTTELGLLVREDKDAVFTVRVALRLVPYVPVITADVLAATTLVVTVKVADTLPAATVTDGGTCAAEVLPLCNVTIAPPAGAALVSVTVPVELFPPTTEVGLNASEDRAPGAMTLRVAFWLTPYVPVITADVVVATALVVTVKVADVLPAGTVTDAGTCAIEVLPLESGTTAPPEGATPFNRTVPVDETPPTTLVGLSVNDDSCGGVTVNPADCVAP